MQQFLLARKDQRIRLLLDCSKLSQCAKLHQVREHVPLTTYFVLQAFTAANSSFKMTLFRSLGSTPTAIMTGERNGLFWLRSIFIWLAFESKSSSSDFVISTKTSPNFVRPSPDQDEKAPRFCAEMVGCISSSFNDLFNKFIWYSFIF